MCHSDPQEVESLKDSPNIRVSYVKACSHQTGVKVERDSVTINDEKSENTFVEEGHHVARVTAILKNTCHLDFLFVTRTLPQTPVSDPGREPNKPISHCHVSTQHTQAAALNVPSLCWS